ncbi:phosphoribosylglycinamide formyltransferase [Oxalicibacterium solurbis]|uniref:Phosphoribosylglycinamide formyltransferase n=2 Tax=Oxalicibacterium solurbis TaxID=69280 RepID=A0A8J3B0B3_9BURK|nr:phosphoribosylglycinamide formyltransferase [Oxalicibacterium solurbis]
MIAGLGAVIVLPAQARDDKLLLSIEDALNASSSKEKLDGSVKFYFGNQRTPKVLKKLGSDASNKKTNAFGKSDEDACQWAFLSAMLSLEQRAKQLGANAVVNIESNYKKVVMSSETQYECHAGAIMAGVALKGDFVKISGK